MKNVFIAASIGASLALAACNQAKTIAPQSTSNTTTSSQNANLVLRLKFEQNLLDQSTYNNHGASKGSTYVGDMFNCGSAVSLNGTTDYVQVAHSNSLNFGTGDFTVSMWLKPTQLGIRQDVFDKKDLFTAPPSQHDFALVQLDNNYLQVFMRGATSAATTFNSTSTVALNTWRHVAIVRKSGTVTLYINGVANNTKFCTDNLSSDGPLRVGSNRAIGTNASGSAVFPYKGAIDEFRMYKVALTAAAIQGLYEEAVPNDCN